MSKKDYEFVAEIFWRHTEWANQQKQPAYKNAMAAVIRDFANKFEHHNPKFKREVFFKACGL